MFKRKPNPLKPNPLLTYLSPKTEFEGILHAEGMLRVDGVIHGTVNIMGDLEISSTGLVEGPEVKAHNILVQGVLKARVFAEGKLTLSRTARLEGDVVAGSLEIEAGAYYSGASITIVSGTEGLAAQAVGGLAKTWDHTDYKVIGS